MNMLHSVLFTFAHAMTNEAADIIPLATGSTAELYIQPMLPCFGDIDIMWHYSSQLAIPQGHTPPTRLPAEFHSRIGLLEITDSEFPGYVYLMLSYLLTQETDDGKYSAIRSMREPVGYQFAREFEMKGPAFFNKGPYQTPFIIGPSYFSGSLVSSDKVFCVRCLSWPSQAVDWSARQRNYDWPDLETISRVVSDGCDVVAVAHRLCRQDEWMNEHQWRLSFSRAEIILLNSWIPVQQIAYHMLRSFMKMESLTDIADNNGSKILSNYNIKTLVLWACEMKGRSWWIDELNVVGICVKLLHILANWLTDAYCPHYFINNCNLFDFTASSHLTRNTAYRLISVAEVSLAKWFVQNYIRTCSCLCPDVTSQMFDDISTHTKLQKAVSAVVDWKLISTLSLAWAHFSHAQQIIHTKIFLYPNVRTSSYWMKEMSKFDQYRYMPVYFTAVTFLQVAFKTNINLLTDEMLDAITVICLQSHDTHRYIRARHSSVLSLSQAAKLMKVIANNPRSTMQLLEIELSKAYLYRTLKYKDSDSDSMYCLANVYLAILYYTTGQYQKAIDHCTLVTRSLDHLQCSSHVVKRELLPKIDDDINIALGLAAFYQYLRTVALNKQHQEQNVGIFTTELFAYYLHNRCQSAMTYRQLTQVPSNTDDVERYIKCFRELPQVFITDVIVFDSVRRTKYSAKGEKPVSSGEVSKPVTSAELDTTELVELLQKSAVERLTICRHLEAREFGSEVTTVTTDFEALYAYKRGDYERCLQLCMLDIRTLISGRRMSRVLSYSEFIQLMNDDIVCLTGLMLLVKPSSRQNYNDVAMSQLSLSLYLMTQCQMKLQHPVMLLTQNLDYIETARRNLGQRFTLDQLLLNLTEHKTVRYITVGK